MINFSDCKIIRSSRKSCAVEIKDGEIILRLPNRLPAGLSAEKIFERFRPWLERKQSEIVEKKVENPPKKIKFGDNFPLFDEFYPLHYGNRSGFKDGFYLNVADEDELANSLRELYIEIADIMLRNRLAELAKSFGLSYGGCRISNAKKRWGSCSNQGKISLNWRLLLIPRALADYIIIHELSHLKELNHSPRFYAEQSRLLPDWQEREARLREFNLKIDNWV